MNFKTLKARQRAERENYSENLSLRVHRALSWLDKAEQCQGDQDSQFIFLWIAFNAAYANEVDDIYRRSEQETFRNFIDRMSLRAVFEFCWRTNLFLTLFGIFKTKK